MFINKKEEKITKKLQLIEKKEYLCSVIFYVK